MESEEEYPATPWWMRMELESDPTSREASSAAYPLGVAPYWMVLSSVEGVGEGLALGRRLALGQAGSDGW